VAKKTDSLIQMQFFRFYYLYNHYLYFCSKWLDFDTNIYRNIILHEMCFDLSNEKISFFIKIEHL